MFRRLREWWTDEASTYVSTETLASAAARERVRHDETETLDADPEMLRRIRARWAAAEASRPARFLRGSFGRTKA